MRQRSSLNVTITCETGPGCLVKILQCFTSSVCGVNHDKEATALVAVCIYISCAALASVQQGSHSEK